MGQDMPSPITYIETVGLHSHNTVAMKTIMPMMFHICPIPVARRTGLCQTPTMTSMGTGDTNKTHTTGMGRRSKSTCRREN
mmetsp:Transcript_148076/g.258319  ORF Transcript_148076/g.258319 Transcript_148076/m.258319 type:complete len:81 (+) Transcript_148076:98-340(+)